MKMTVDLTIKIPVWLDFVFAWPAMLYRYFKFGYTYRRIYLGQGKYTIVDPSDYYWLKEYNWCVGGNGKDFYAFRNVVVGPGKTKRYSMHREIMGFPEGLFVDHRNNKTLDDRRENLRTATCSQNHMNSRRDKSKTSSKYRGVSLEKNRNKWAANIDYNNKRVFLGRFDNEIEAARVYDEAAKKYHGEFARLNFP